MKRGSGAGEPVAIVGMACIFPRSPDLRAYWRNILAGFDAVRDVPEERWRHDLYYAPDRRAPERTYAKRGAFLEEVRFDPVRYMIPPASVDQVEPAQLLSLEVARLALEDAGWERDGFPRDRTSVIVACSGIHDVGIGYAVRSMLPHFLERAPELDAAARDRIVASVRDSLPPWTEDAFPGFLPNVIAGRIANRLDLRGANFVVDAACSSSLAAFQTAVAQLRDGTCDVALVAAVDGSNNAFTFMSFAKTYALTPGDRPRPFDAAADGVVLGEGVGAVVVKRLADAERDGDRVYAVVRGVGCSSDGRNRSLTAPHAPGQVLAMNRAYADAGIDPATVGLVEAHATGTAVGDAVEIAAMSEVFGMARGEAGRAVSGDATGCGIGSVKSNIGHAKAAAGMAGLIKAALAVHHRVLPPTINVEKPNGALGDGRGPLYVNSEARPWVRRVGDGADHPHRAGVSAFGFGGTNFHVVLERHGSESSAYVDLTPRPAEVFAWRRSTRQELAGDLGRLRDALRRARPARVRLDELAHAVFADERRRGAPPPDAARAAIVAATVDELDARLEQAVRSLADAGTHADARGVYVSDEPPANPSAVAFLFPGQGAQRPGMLADLVQYGPFGGGLFEEADGWLADLLPAPLSSFVFPRPPFGRDEATRQARELADTRIAQPAVGVMDLFATDVLARFGIRPAMTAGHSYGEYVALCVAGAYGRRSLLRLSAKRGRAVHECATAGDGGMAAVAAGEAETRAALDELGIPAHVANLNAPRQTIVGGPTAVIDDVLLRLPEQGLAVRRVAVTAAFHTPALRPVEESLTPLLEELEVTPPALPVYSNVTAEPCSADADAVRSLLMRHLAHPVRFVEQIRAMHRDGARVFLEVGPGRILTGLVRRILAGEPHTVIAMDDPGGPAWAALGQLLAHVHALGLPVDLSPWFERRGLSADDPVAHLDRLSGPSPGRETDWWLQPAGSRPAGGAQPRWSAVAAAPRPPEPTRTRLAGDAAAGFQEILAQWLELQQQQNRLTERFLALQERLLDDGAPAAAPRPSAPAPTPASPPASPPGLVVAPAPVLPQLRPTVATTAPALADTRLGTAISPESGGDIPTVETFQRDLLDEVTRRTGYPEEVLELDLPLEAGLGIDSIKLMEVFSALRPYHHVLADEDMPEEEIITRFAGLRSLGAIIDHYATRREEILASGAPAPARVTRESPATAGAPTTGAETVDRLVVRAVPAPLSGAVAAPALGQGFPRAQIVLAVGGRDPLGAALLTALDSRGVEVIQAVPGDGMSRRGDRRYEVDLSSAACVEALAAAIVERGELRVGAVLNLLNLDEGYRDPALDAPEAPLRIAQSLLNVAQAFETDVRAAAGAGGGLVVNVTALDGRLGLAGGGPLAVAHAASLGFCKSLAREWAGVRVRNIDVDPAADPEALLAGLAAEMSGGMSGDAGAAEVGLDGTARWRLELVEEADPGGDAVELETGSVVLALGGGLGIGAAALERLARPGVRFVVVGRSRPAEEDAEPEEIRGVSGEQPLREALLVHLREGSGGGATPAAVERRLESVVRARQLRENLDTFVAAGAEVEYHALDVRDDAALETLLEGTYAEHGRIDGVIHAAGVVEDGLLRDKTPESFARVFETKVRPAFTLARALRPDGLRFLAFFSSVSARFGNVGQTDYAAANECLGKLAAHLDRGWPARVVALDWGPWDGGMVSDGLRSAYAERGIRLIPPDAGARAFEDEVLRTAAAPEVVLACDVRGLRRAMEKTTRR